MTATNHAQLAQHAAENWLDELWSVDPEAGEELPEGGELFCGCTTCVVREVLDAAAPHLWHCYTDILRSHGIELPDNVESLLDS